LNTAGITEADETIISSASTCQTFKKNQSWMKEIEDEKRIYTFTPLERGRYIIESIYKEREPGSFKGKNYEECKFS
jgi:hypothetical protein